MPKPPVEPFRIKSVEPLRMLSRKERKTLLEKAGYNPFNLRSEEIFIDLLTDSGTGAMSHHQWGRLMEADEAYAGSRSFYHFEETVRDITGYEHIIPTHQGRAAENILFSVLVQEGQSVPNNAHFDTTRANIEARGALAADIYDPEMTDPSVKGSFKGNISISGLQAFIEKQGPENVPCGMLTVTNNTRAGQPVSMSNIRQAADLLHSYGRPLFLDAARFAENAWFIKQREPGYADTPVLDIAREMFSYADGCTVSAKKDGISNIGGFIGLRDGALAEQVRHLLIRIEGFPTYGGLSGRDMEALAVGLREVLDEDYLRYRIDQTAFLGKSLLERGVPCFEPFGGHAVYVDAGRFAPHLPQSQFPGQVLACEAYIEGGVRTVEIGSVMFAYPDPKTWEVRYPDLELVRLALPRRVYTNTHLEYVADTFAELLSRRDELKGLEMTYAPTVLRHFRARFKPIQG
jgi:tyrosine phenol-lyase